MTILNIRGCFDTMLRYTNENDLELNAVINKNTEDA